MIDQTETLRKERLAELNSEAGERTILETKYGQVWTTEELQRDFEVIGFLAPMAVVKRRSDGQKGSLEFQATPRYYFNFEEYKPR